MDDSERFKGGGFGVLVDTCGLSDNRYALYATGWKGWYADRRMAQLCAARWRKEVPAHWRVYVVRLVSSMQDCDGSLTPIDPSTGELLPLDPDWVQCDGGIDEDGVRHRAWRHKQTGEYRNDRPTLHKPQPSP